jgi:hypothetical protein
MDARAGWRERVVLEARALTLEKVIEGDFAISF